MTPPCLSGQLGRAVFITFRLAGHWASAWRHLLVPDEAMIAAANRERTP